MNEAHRRFAAGFVIAVGATALAGCGLTAQGSRGTAYENLTDAGRPHQEPASVELPESAHLDDYLRIALERNPTLERARLEAAAAGYRVAQATALPNPVVSAAPPTGEMTETAAGEVEWSAGITQQVPFPAKLMARGTEADHAARAAAERYRAASLQISAEVRRAYYRLYFADRATAITRESRTLLSYFRDIAARKYEAGQVPQQDLLRAQVELANLETDLVTLGESRSTAEARLNQLMARPLAEALPATPELVHHRTALELDELLELADGANPELAAARARLDQAGAALELAKLEYLPDFSIGYTYTEVADSGLSAVANGDDNWRLALGITLPIWFGRLAAGRNEASAQLEAERSALSALRDSTAFRIDEAKLKVETQQRLVALFDGVIVPQAKQTLDATISAYRSGQVDFLTLINNWRRLLDFQVSRQRSLAAFEQELAELERIVGTGLATSEHGPAGRDDES